MLAKVYDGDKLVAEFVVNAHDFKTGSVGFYGNDKTTINGVRYQTQLQIVKVGSNPNSKAAKAAAQKQADIQAIKATVTPGPADSKKLASLEKARAVKAAKDAARKAQTDAMRVTTPAPVPASTPDLATVLASLATRLSAIEDLISK